MSFISRFLKFGKSDKALDEAEQALTEDSEDGLFMSSRPWENLTQADEPAAEAPADELADEAAVEALADELADEAAVEAPADELADEAASEAPADELADEAQETSAGADDDDLLDAGQDDLAEAATAEAPAEEAQASLDGGDESSSEQASSGEESSGDGGDDLLSAFRDTADASEAAGLTEDLEDTPMRELLTELREIRGSISVPINAEDGEIEEDVA